MTILAPTLGGIVRDPTIPQAPRWLSPDGDDVHYSRHPVTENLTLRWAFEPVTEGQAQSHWRLRRGVGTTVDPFRWWTGSVFSTEVHTIPGDAGSVTLPMNDVGRFVFQVSTKAEGTQWSSYSAAFEVRVVDDVYVRFTNTATRLGQLPILDWIAYDQVAYRLRGGGHDPGWKESSQRRERLRLEPMSSRSQFQTFQLTVRDQFGREHSTAREFELRYQSPESPTCHVFPSDAAVGVQIGGRSHVRRYEIWRSFTSHHVRGGAQPAEAFGLPYPDERLVKILYTNLPIGGQQAWYDHTVRFGWHYQYRVAMFAANDETFSLSDWVS